MLHCIFSGVSVLSSVYLFQELDAEGRAPLHTAVCNRQLEVIRYLISPESEGGAKVDVNQKTIYGKTPCDEARIRKLSEIVSMLEKVET